MKTFVLVTKVTPMLLAFFHFINSLLSYFNIELPFLNYISGVSIITISYLYVVSYAINLCEYYRMFLHYCVVLIVFNTIDYYIGIPISDLEYYIIFLCITIVFMFITIYLKFFKCRS